MAGRLTVLAFALGMGALAGCGDGRGGGGWAGQVDTLAGGTIVVRSPVAGVWSPGTAWRLEEDLRIGSVEGAGPDVFGDVAGVAVDEAGRIWVLDRQAKELRIFGSAGEHIRTVGREGGGPGEFKDPIGLALDGRGRAWVVDAGNARFSIHDSTGEFVETRRRPVAGYSVPWRGGFGEDGGLWEATVVAGDDGIRRVLLRFDAELQPRDTLFLPELDVEEVFELRTEGGYMAADVPFTPGLLWSMAADGALWLANSGEYRLHRTVGGDTVRVVERDFEPVPVTEEERREAMENLEWFVSQGGRVDASRIPDTKPIVRRFSVDPAGRPWVLVREPGDPEGHRFDVFDAEGRYLGPVRSPVALSPHPIFRGDAVYGVDTDDLGVEHIVRLRLRRPEG